MGSQALAKLHKNMSKTVSGKGILRGQLHLYVFKIQYYFDTCEKNFVNCRKCDQRGSV